MLLRRAAHGVVDRVRGNRARGRGGCSGGRSAGMAVGRVGVAARWMVGRGGGGAVFGWVLGAHCLSRKTLRNAGWWAGMQGRLLVEMPVGWVLRGWWMSGLGLAWAVHLVLWFVLVGEVVQDSHLEVEGERSRRDLAVPLRLRMEFDAGGRWVAAAVRLML